MPEASQRIAATSHVPTTRRWCAYCAGAGLSHAVLGARSHFFIQAQTLLGTRGPTTPFAVSMVPDRHFLVYSGPPGESSMCVGSRSRRPAASAARLAGSGSAAPEGVAVEELSCVLPTATKEPQCTQPHDSDCDRQEWPQACSEYRPPLAPLLVFRSVATG